MKIEKDIALTIVLVIFMVVQMGYMRYMRENYWVDNTQFKCVGMIAYEQNGDTVYFPVYKKQGK